MVRFISTCIAVTLALAPFASSAALPGNNSSPDNKPDPGITPVSGDVVDGHLTWYGKDCGEQGCWNGAACQFVNYTLPSTIDGTTCISGDLWDNSFHCGACVEVTYQGKKKILMITNETDGDKKHLDLTPNAFSQLADKSVGRIFAPWRFVQCPISSPIQIHMHGGSSQWWFAAVVYNARLHTAKLEVSADSGKTWRNTIRKSTNFFTLVGGGGTGTKTAWVRVTSDTGSQVVVKDVVMASDVTTTGTSNYA